MFGVTNFIKYTFKLKTSYAMKIKRIVRDKENWRFILGLLIGIFATWYISWYFSTPSLSAEEIIEKGDESYMFKEYENAIKWYDKTIDIDRKNRHAWQFKGYSYLGLAFGNVYEFPEIIDNCDRLASSNDSKHYLLRAEHTFYKYSTIDVTDTRSLNHAGLAFYCLGILASKEEKNRDATADYMLAKSLFNESIDRALILKEQGYIKQSDCDFRYDMACAWYGMGKTLEKEGNKSMANGCFKNARGLIDSFPHVEIMYNDAWMYKYTKPICEQY